MTLQLAESHSGLRVAPDETTPPQLVSRDDDKAVFFPSLGFQDRVQPTLYKAGWHDVLSTDQLNTGRTITPRTAEVCGRWAMIFFADAQDHQFANNLETHAR